MTDVKDTLVRPLRQRLGEIGLFSFVFCALTFISSLLDTDVQQQGAHGLRTWVMNGGETLASQIDWFYGITISLLLGLYAFIGGGQLLEIANARGTQRRLRLLGELLTAATVPWFVILAVWSVISVDRLMLILLPAEAMVMFLGTGCDVSRSRSLQSGRSAVTAAVGGYSPPEAAEMGAPIPLPWEGQAFFVSPCSVFSQ